MRRLVLVLPLLALLLSACDSGDGGSPGSLPQPPDRLVLVRNEGIVERSLVDGSEELLIPSSDDVILLHPAVSPDRKQLAYVRQLITIVVPGSEFDAGSDVYVATIDGSDPQLVREHEQRGDLISSPRWLPDGSLLVSITRFDEGVLLATIERVDPATGERTIVLEDGYHPAPTPDGERIFFIRNDEQFHQSLWTANIDGSDIRIVAGPGQNLGSMYSPRVSPDGTTVAFGAAELLASSVSAPGARFIAASRASAAYNGLPADVWLLDIASGDVRRLADLDLDSPSFAWSGDGSRLYVFSGTGLFIVEPATGDVHELGEGTYHGQVDWLATDEQEGES